ncbi:bifunctional farnesyl-diphosphate farnesyltransferase/squalene synthase [Stygiomarasmius scandens]|uniref:Squalene synthase n=1 Tax=Marasmiellus scandens TaxID=2682957 RepID=A0ABR1JAV1_9AGAR
MGLAAWITLLLTHPIEFRVLIQYYLYHEQKRDITAMKEHETSGWDRQTMRRCWYFLDMTSRSFSAVIKELDGDLARTVCLFYLVLRGLDTIEDDMTIPDEKKQPILRQFHKLTVTPGWKYDGCGPNEKDRQLLVEYDQVVDELNLLDTNYRDVILDVTEKMQTGMADFAHKAATTGSIYVETIADYDLYCHYVAGLVGEGLSRLFSASKKEVEWLGTQLELSNSMGLLLQKTNIIRDYREDCEENRFFWPREIWGQEKYGFKEMKEMHAPEAAERAQWVQTEMILDAMRHLTDSLDYLRLLKNQSVFAFCAIPATMAIATLELCFMNPEMFQRNIKIRKADAASLIMRSTNPREVASIFRTYCRKIHARARPQDPNFLRLSVACGKVEQWCEHNYPSFVQMPSTAGSPPTFNPEDARSKILLLEQETEKELTKKKRLAEIRKKVGAEGANADANNVQVQAGSSGSEWEIFLYVASMVVTVLGVSMGIVYIVLRFFSD